MPFGETKIMTSRVTVIDELGEIEGKRYFAMVESIAVLPEHEIEFMAEFEQKIIPVKPPHETVADARGSSFTGLDGFKAF